MSKEIEDKNAEKRELFKWCHVFPTEGGLTVGGNFAFGGLLQENGDALDTPRGREKEKRGEQEIR